MPKEDCERGRSRRRDAISGSEVPSKTNLREGHPEQSEQLQRHTDYMTVSVLNSRTHWANGRIHELRKQFFSDGELLQGERTGRETARCL